MKRFSIRSTASTIIACLLLLTLAGCLQGSDALTDPATSAVDANLLGVWRNRGGEYLFIGKLDNPKIGPPGLMTLAKASYSNGTVSSEQMMYFTTSAIAGRTYVNLFSRGAMQPAAFTNEGDYQKWDADPKHTVTIIRYQIQGETLVRSDSLADDKDIKAALDVSHLTPTKSESGLVYSNTDLARVLASDPGNALFPLANRDTYERISN